MFSSKIILENIKKQTLLIVEALAWSASISYITAYFLQWLNIDIHFLVIFSSVFSCLIIKFFKVDGWKSFVFSILLTVILVTFFQYLNWIP